MDTGAFFFVIVIVLSPFILMLAVAAFAIVSGVVFLVGSGITMVVSGIVARRRNGSASRLVDETRPDQILNG